MGLVPHNVYPQGDTYLLTDEEGCIYHGTKDVPPRLLVCSPFTSPSLRVDIDGP